MRLGCAPLVSVVKTAYLRYRNDGSELQRLHGPWLRYVLSEREEQLHMPVVPIENSFLFRINEFARLLRKVNSSCCKVKANCLTFGLNVRTSAM
jgi:hypothetical protein